MSFPIFKIARKASLEESPFSKVIGEIPTLYNFVENSITCVGVFQKVVLLEISRSLVCKSSLLKAKPQPNSLNVQTEIYNVILS